MLNMLNRLTDSQESGQTLPWRVEDAPPDYIRKLMRGIVGIEIRIARVDGKLKASQDEDMQDRHGTVKGLQSNHSQQSQNMAELVLGALTSEAPQS
jgi:transcriptional regulator